MQLGLDGVTIDSSIYRPATFVEAAAANLGLTLLLALILAGGGGRRVHAAVARVVIALIAATLSLIAAALVLHALGATVNAMVIAGLVVALAVVLDDAISDVDNAIRRLREPRPDGSSPSSADILAVSVMEVRGSVVFATAIILLVLVPVMVIDGVTGSFLQPFATAFALAVVTSMVVGLTLTPALAVLLLGKTKLGDREPRTVSTLHGRYQDVLVKLLRRPAPAFAAAGVILVLAVVAVPQLASSLAPTFQERDLLVNVKAAPGTSQPAMNRVAAQATAELRAIPGIRRVGTHVGRAIMSDQVVNINSGQLWVSIDPAADYDSTLAVRSRRRSRDTRASSLPLTPT